MTMLRGLFSLLTPAGAQARLSILIFHRVLPVQDPLFPGEMHASSFDAVCGWVSRWFNVLPLDQAVARLRGGDLPARSLSVTFDDGYADNHDVALPILKKHKLPATFYIATGFLDGGRMWNDSVIEAVRRTSLSELDLAPLGLDGMNHLPVSDLTGKRTAIETILSRIKYLPMPERLRAVSTISDIAGVELPSDLMMRSDQVRQLHRAGMQIGAHTVSHPILATLSKDEAKAEILQSKQALESLIEDRVGLFAYPNGVPGKDYSAETATLVQALGFDCAVTTGWGVSQQDTDVYQLPRFTPWDRSRLRFGMRMLKNLRSV
jgi:peptidoglycan/xylan/chitin deacetylase (PgdA/CDA1 family)